MEIKAFICPPAIAPGADCNVITREEVARLRAGWRRQYGALRPNLGQGGVPKGRKPKAPAKPKGPTEVEKLEARLVKAAEKIAAHAVKYYPKSKKQRRWDIIVECWTHEQILAEIKESGETTMGGIVKHFDRLLDLLADAERI